MGVQEVDRQWYVSRNGKRYGPYTYAALTEAAALGAVTADTNVWRLGWVSWHPAWQVPGLIEEPSAVGEVAEEGSSIVPVQERPDDGGDADAAPGLAHPEDRREEHRVSADHAEEDSVSANHDVEDSISAAQSRDAATDDGVALQTAAQGAPEIPLEGAPGDLPRAAAQQRSQAGQSEDRSQIQDDSKVAPLNLGQGTLQDRQAGVQPEVSETASPDAIADHPPGAERLLPPHRASATAALRAMPEEAPEPVEQAHDTDVAMLPPQIRDGLPEQTVASRPPRGRDRLWKAALGALVLILAAGSIWGLLASGTVIVIVPRLHYNSGELSASQLPRPEDAGQRAALSPGEDRLSGAAAAAYTSSLREGRGLFPVSSKASPAPAFPASPAQDALPPETVESGLPAAVAALPAVVALKSTASTAFAKFKQRFGEAAANAPEHDFLALARTALRKSVKRQLANASADTLIEITETYLDYMQAMQFSNPQSCVALSDDTKGANLTLNIEQEFPALFAREMALLARVAAIDPGAVVAPLTIEQARPSLETVFTALRSQPVRSDLLGRGLLQPPDFLPFCQLAIAFYDDVLALPAEQRINLLRYLYAAAADQDDARQPK